uniref:Uncharacterized protein n=1 Tax=Arundo donax TaxID=35708 RepID=A0A0A8XNZ8_ARUDO
MLLEHIATKYSSVISERTFVSLVEGSGTLPCEAVWVSD